MKSKNAVFVLATTISLALATSSCSKKEEAPPPTTSDATKPAEGLAGDAQKALEAQKAAAEKAGADVAKAAEAQKAAAEKAAADASAAASAKAQGFIDQAKELVSQKKYTEALNALKPLADLKLTPEQQKVLDELKVQITKAMATSSLPAVPKP